MSVHSTHTVIHFPLEYIRDFMYGVTLCTILQMNLEFPSSNADCTLSNVQVHIANDLIAVKSIAFHRVQRNQSSHSLFPSFYSYCLLTNGTFEFHISAKVHEFNILWMKTLSKRKRFLFSFLPLVESANSVSTHFAKFSIFSFPEIPKLIMWKALAYISA